MQERLECILNDPDVLNSVNDRDGLVNASYHVVIKCCFAFCEYKYDRNPDHTIKMHLNVNAIRLRCGYEPRSCQIPQHKTRLKGRINQFIYLLALQALMDFFFFAFYKRCLSCMFSKSESEHLYFKGVWLSCKLPFGCKCSHLFNCTLSITILNILAFIKRKMQCSNPEITLFRAAEALSV